LGWKIRVDVNTRSGYGQSAIESALLMLPMAIAMVALAPVVGKLISHVDLRVLAALGFAGAAGSLIWMGVELPTLTSGWGLLAPFGLLGGGTSFIAPAISTAAMRDIPPDLAGAGSGAFNALRQTGAVLGSATIAALMTVQLGSTGPDGGFGPALGPVMFLPAGVLLIGMVSVLFLRSPASNRK
jgi:hypothetical protein